MRRTPLLLLAFLTACGAGPKPAATPAPTPTRTASTVVEKVTTGGSPCGIVAAAGAVWVTDADGARLLRIAGGRVTRTYPIDKTPCELTYGYGSLWVATQSGVLDRVDPKTGRVAAKITVGDTSYEPLVAFGSVWVTNRNSNTVSQVDPATNRVTRTIKTELVNAGGIVAAAGSLWVGDDSSGSTSVVRLDPRTGKQRKVNAGKRPAFVTAAAGSVWVANQDDGTVTRIDAKTGEKKGTVKAGTRPVNLAALPGPRPEVWVPDDAGNQVVRIDATTGEAVETLPVGNGPAVVAPDGPDLWVTNFSDGSVWRIRPSAR
jgi:YVTN family beta-propeller protein